MIDNYEDKLKQYKPLIVNTDDSNGGGIHWVLFYPLFEKVFIFDPLGKQSKSIAGQWQGNPPSNSHFYRGKIQNNSSVLCGYYVLHIAKLFKKKQPTTIKECARIIEDEFGLTADYGDVAKMKKKYISLAKHNGF